MKELQQTYITKFSSLLMFYIILQPVLDIATSISIMYYDSTVTIGIVVRLLFMVLALIFIILTKKKFAILYIGALLLVIAIGFILAFVLKPNFSIFAEAQYYAKGFYFVVMFVSYTLALMLLKQISEKNLINIVMKPIVIAMTIVGVVFLVAAITGAGFDTYRHMKAGTKAWFNAGNEIGAILSICLPIVILFAIKATKNFKHVYYWLPALLVIFSLIMLGTKVGYLAVMFTLIITFLLLGLLLMKKTDDRNIKPSFLIVTIILATVTVVSPYTPAFTNTGLHMSFIDENKDEEDLEEELEGIEDGAMIDSELSNFVNDHPTISVILSGRQFFWIETHEMFVEAPLIQKLFGMGYAGNYPKKPKLIEMDFLDLFYSYGIIGFFIFLLPFFYAIVKIIAKCRTYRYKILRVEFALVLTSLLLGAGIAFIAGHVLFAPAVSIYLAVLYAYIFADFELVK